MTILLEVCVCSCHPSAQQVLPHRKPCCQLPAIANSDPEDSPTISVRVSNEWPSCLSTVRDTRTAMVKAEAAYRQALHAAADAGHTNAAIGIAAGVTADCVRMFLHRERRRRSGV